MEIDVVVIGGGAAGLSAAMMLARARRQVTVIDAGEPRNAPAQHIHGFLSRDGIAPLQLLAIGRDELVGYGGQVVQARATAIEQLGDRGFVVRCDGSADLTARVVVVASGLRDELPKIPGLRQRWGVDVCTARTVTDMRCGICRSQCSVVTTGRSRFTKRHWCDSSPLTWSSSRTGSS